MINSYLQHAQLDVDANLIAAAVDKLDHYFLHSVLPDVRWQYLIPELGEGGACSLFGHLQAEPFKLSDHLNQDQQTELKLANLQRIVDFVREYTGVDWFGIYQTTDTAQGPQLLKLAYYGAPSRPLFPLTAAFATGSNNVQVALSKTGRIINNVQQYLAQGGEYYTCDPKVKSEVCLPLFDQHNACVGIIDAEAFNSDFFNQTTLSVLIAACIKIPQYLV